MKQINDLPQNEENYRILMNYVTDSIKGYETIASKLEDDSPLVQSTIDTILTTRSGISKQLADAIDQPNEDGGTLAGSAHRALIHIKDLMTFDGEDGQLIEEIVRGENALIEYIDKNFELVGPLDNPVIRIVSELKNHVLNSVLAVRNVVPETLGMP